MKQASPKWHATMTTAVATAIQLQLSSNDWRLLCLQNGTNGSITTMKENGSLHMCVCRVQSRRPKFQSPHLGRDEAYREHQQPQRGHYTAHALPPEDLHVCLRLRGVCGASVSDGFAVVHTAAQQRRVDLLLSSGLREILNIPPYHPRTPWCGCTRMIYRRTAVGVTYTPFSCCRRGGCHTLRASCTSRSPC